jgi:hypothetical protein
MSKPQSVQNKNNGNGVCTCRFEASSLLTRPLFFSSSQRSCTHVRERVCRSTSLRIHIYLHTYTEGCRYTRKVMSAHRLALSADAHEGRPPQRRNLAAGKRLVPLPPRLRSRVHDVPPTDLSSQQAGTDFAHTAPVSHHSPVHSQRSGHRAQLTNRSASRGYVGSSSYNSNNTSHSDGRRHLPPVRQGESSLADAAHSRRASTASESCGGSPFAAPSSSSSTARSGARASTSEGARRASPLRRVDHGHFMTSAAPAGKDSCGGGGSVVAGSGVASARVGRLKPRAPVLPRTSTRAATNTFSPTSDAPAGVVEGTTASPSRADNSGILSRAKHNVAAPAASASTYEPRECTGPSMAAPPVTSSAATGVKVLVSVPELPQAPHDMDERFYANRAEWCTADELPPLVWSLLEGSTLEPPHSSYLWTQAYPQPAELLPTPTVSGAQLNFATGGGGGNGGGDVTSALPSALQHRDTAKRSGGFYACVRCATPVCSPAFQVIPATPALRGIAVFSRLNVSGVDLHLRTALEGHGGGAGAERLSFAGAAAAADRKHAPSNGEMTFLVHCHHCNGCLGVMFIGEVALFPLSAAAANFTTTTVSTSSSAAAGFRSVAHELLCVNSVCLRYMPYSTHAALDGELLGMSDGADRGATTGAAAGVGAASVTMGTLFGPPRVTAWNLQGDLLKSDGNGSDQRCEDGGSGDVSFDDLLKTLNPYSGNECDESD